jgi:putative hydrolase of the HAD superfamily
LKETLRYALFDLDNTLYPSSCGLWQEIGRRINLYMTERLGIDPQEVSGRRDEFLKAFGTTLNALRHYYSVDPDEFLGFVHDIPLDRYLRHEPELDRMLGRVALSKIIFTNADAQHARRVLSRLGILRHFEFIVDIHMLEFINKPDPRAYLKALEFASATAEECILIEDTPVNIIPARKLGMTTVLVGSQSDGAHHHIQRIADLEKLLPLIKESRS